MTIAVILEPPKSMEDFVIWSFAHAAHHRDINRVVFERVSTVLPDYILDPFDPSDMPSWLYQHQLMHDAQNAILGIAGHNLTALDWEERDTVATWFWNHGQEHYQAGAVLELG